MAVTIDEVEVDVAERPAAPQTPARSASATERPDLASAFQRLAERQNRLKAD